MSYKIIIRDEENLPTESETPKKDYTLLWVLVFALIIAITCYFISNLNNNENDNPS